MSAQALSMRQMVEGMALGFEPAEAPAHAVLEFAFTGDERGTYQLVIEGGSCQFERRPVATPTMRIETDAEVWRAVSERRLEPIAAVMDGRLKVEGDLGLFQLFRKMFRQLEPEDLRAPRSQRAPGPVRLPAMAWLFVGLVPWKTFWVVTALRGPERALVVAMPVAVVLLAVRELTRTATFFERVTAVIFTAAGIATVLGSRPPSGIIGMSLLALAAIWAASIVHARYPLTAEYSRWNYVPRLWGTTLFRHPNALLTLLWAGIFTVLAIIAAAGARGWVPGGVSTALSLAISAGGGIVTRRHEARARYHRIDDPDRSLLRLRRGARLLCAMIAVGFLLMGDPRTSPGWLLLPAVVLATAALWRSSRLVPEGAIDERKAGPGPGALLRSGSV